MNKNFQIVGSILLSGAAWYGAFDLSGDYGWLLWLAPVPVLYTCYRVKAGQAFLFAFISFLIGRLSWLPYLLSVLPLAVAILFTVFFPLVFAAIVWVQRRAVLKGLPPAASSVIIAHPVPASTGIPDLSSSSSSARIAHPIPASTVIPGSSPSHPSSGLPAARPIWPWLAILILPLLWTAMEFALSRLGRDGTITSIACTQANYLPLIQVVSLTGMTGLSFLLHLLPSAIAVSWFYIGRSHGHSQSPRQVNFRAARLLALPLVLLTGTLIVGWLRLTLNPVAVPNPATRNPVPASNAIAPAINVLLLTVNESAYQKNTYQPGPAIDSQIPPRHQPHPPPGEGAHPHRYHRTHHHRYPHPHRPPSPDNPHRRLYPDPQGPSPRQRRPRHLPRRSSLGQLPQGPSLRRGSPGRIYTRRSHGNI